ncbi:hydrogenase accessory protein HypB [Candidatus Izimaplasma bacterium ZiA1]|uniref:hydrogenase nickel incorporation protein HypB n=1 Tax=Candidatus Izimoplasma sp. ZiA1 TaxID=2024899 RepID=UPI000BAA8361|nr:hydrogenase accessory protein HypB [Candidatus Izimaplasma bacterium ZiA1]
MENFRVLEIQKRVYENNDLEAEKLRGELKKNRTFLLNLMSSPGSGKTTSVVSTINILKEDMKIGVIEADIDSDVDAITVSKSGAKVMQLHSGGMCHLDAGMAREGLDIINSEDLDFVILENIGNLICPASYDLGAVKNAMILSVPEGDDKPLKYPKMFSKVDVLLISKIDTVSVFNFDFEAVKERVTKLNPTIKVFAISAKTGEGMQEWCSWLKEEIIKWNTK